ncbi:MAG: dTDP-4-dehydrorhamnose reductase [Elusimicrobiota bacterium]|jgi:dTDP-4-dehydrorhamnose reductase|nr:dTDP-4-dehydrorhamnose reductase [Elusimicrobiota bacterium]
MIWITGANGMLAKEFPFFLNKSYKLLLTGREIDIANIDKLHSFVIEKTKEENIDWIINCAAFTDVDKAEDEPELCKAVNLKIARNLAICAKQINAKLIQISTDYVFDGASNKPYLENDKASPINIYGQTKLDGEIEIQRQYDKFYIIRTSWLYGKYGKSFVSTMLKLMSETTKLSVVNDQYGSPTWSFNAAEFISCIINATRKKEIPYGIYHFSNDGITTWYGFAKKIYELAHSMKILKNLCEIVPCSSKDFPLKAKRPAFSVLDKSKIRNVLTKEIPYWDKSLGEFLKICAI